MTTTSFEEKPFTYSVVYGCTRFIIGEMSRWLKRADEFAFHPLLLPMMFAEIERLRLLEPLERKGGELSLRILDMENRLQDEEGSRKTSHMGDGSSFSLTKRDCDAIRLWLSTSDLKDGMKSLLLQLEAMRRHLNNVKNNFGPSSVGLSTNRFNQECSKYMDLRMEEIMAEFQSRLQGCESQLGAMTLATQMVRNHLFSTLYPSLYDSGTIVMNLSVLFSDDVDDSSLKNGHHPIPAYPAKAFNTSHYALKINS